VFTVIFELLITVLSIVPPSISTVVAERVLADTLSA
jgi:hypothetical protein